MGCAKLLKYSLMYKARQVIKGKALADFVVKSTRLEEDLSIDVKQSLYMEDLSNRKGKKIQPRKEKNKK